MENLIEMIGVDLEGMEAEEMMFLAGEIERHVLNLEEAASRGRDKASKMREILKDKRSETDVWKLGKWVDCEDF